MSVINCEINLILTWKHQRDRYFCNIDLNESLDNIKEIIMLLKK